MKAPLVSVARPFTERYAGKGSRGHQGLEDGA